MTGSTFGTIFKITTWGESHGAGIGVVVDGCPAGLELSETHIQAFLDRRKPGASRYTTHTHAPVMRITHLTRNTASGITAAAGVPPGARRSDASRRAPSHRGSSQNLASRSQPTHRLSAASRYRIPNVHWKRWLSRNRGAIRPACLTEKPLSKRKPI